MLEVESPGGKTRAELILERPRWEVRTPGAGPPQIRAVESTATLPSEKNRPIAGAKAIITEPARSAEEAGGVTKPDARRVSNVEAPSNTARRPHGKWMLIALVLVVAGASAFHAMRVARRRPSPPPR
jgi:hypothetical protein